MGPATLVTILRERDPVEAWERVCAGDLTKPSKASPQPDQSPLFAGDEQATTRRSQHVWASVASRMDAATSWAKAEEAGVEVAWFGSDRYPEFLADDPNPPGVLFWRGSLACLSRPRVAIVGTRNATPDGRAIAFELGRDLTLAGVCVVSGLALGIDGAAHFGALEALPAHGNDSGPSSVGPPLGVAASGIDVPYPRQHAGLWERVCVAGAVLSETPPGQPAQAWRFPARNRIIAALSLMVVVVESHMTGGSLITVEAALERGIEVRAVPGPVRSPASEGSNQLLYDGPGPVRNAQDVLDALGLFLPGSRASALDDRGQRSDAEKVRRRQIDRLGSAERAVLEAVGWRTSSLGQIVDRSGTTLAEVAVSLDRLEARGLIRRQGGWWTRS
jgi:DNA processing protein